MATLIPGTEVSIRTETLAGLNFPPPEGAVLLVAVHEGSLRAPQSLHTQLIGLRYGDVVWAGAMGEDQLTVMSEGGPDPRQLLGDVMGAGARLWDVVWPLELMAGSSAPRSTVYRGERPWVVIGEAEGGDLLAAPLNDAGNPKWFTPLLAADEVLMSGSNKESQLELAHVWSLPASLPAVGSVAPGAREELRQVLGRYF